MKRPKRFMATLLTLAFVVFMITASPVLAYFSDHIEATGKIPIELGFTTEMEERVEGFVKTIKIFNDGPESCYVRAMAFAGDDLKLSYEGEGWSKGSDDWYYYGPVLGAEQETAPLKVTISNAPEDAQEGDTFNVVVVYESTKVLYGEDGEPLEADWSLKGIEKE